MSSSDAIARAIEELHVETTPQLDGRVLADAGAALDQATGIPVPVGLWGRIPRSRAIRVAAVIALVAAALVVAVYVLQRPAADRGTIVEDRDSPAPIERDGPDETRPEVPERRDYFANERKQIEQLFVAGDVDGLVGMLSTASDDGKILAAGYLGAIGDRRALAALAELAEQWQGDVPENPFKQAIEQIESRLETQQTKAEPDDKTPDTAVAPAEPAFEFKPKGVLSGLITDAETAEPVTDAQIRVYISRVHDTKTDENGFYSFDKINKSGNYKVKITSKGYIGITDYETLPTVYLEKDKQAVRHFALERACQVEVRVIDEDGEPIRGATLVATHLADDRSQEVGDSSRSRGTDEDGMMLMGGFKASEIGYLVTAWHRGKEEWVEQDGRRRRRSYYDYAPAGLVLKLTDPNVIEYAEIMLKKGISVQGYAEYADGVPAEGLTIYAYPDWWHTNYSPDRYPVEPNGYFSFPHVDPGPHSIHVGIPQGGGSTISFSVMQVELPPTDGLLMVRVPQRSPGNLVTITGTIVFVGVKDPGSLHIDAYPTGGGRTTRRSISVRPDREDGSSVDFVIDRLEPGRYTLRFQGQGVENKTLNDIEAPGEGLVVELAAESKPRLTGTVVRADTAEPVAAFKARARKLRTLRGPNYVQNARWIDVRHSEGRFDIEAVGPGIYQVQVAAKGLAHAWSGQVNTDQNAPVVIELSKGGAVRGAVVNESGDPVAGARVIPLSKAGGAMPRTAEMFVSQDTAVITDSTGAFALANLTPGSETLRVTHEQYAFSLARGIEVVEGQETAGVQVVLATGGAAEGVVYDEKGTPQANVTLFFQDDSGYGGSGDERAGRLATVVTDSNGFYRVEHLSERMCFVRRSDPWKSLGVVRRAFLPQNGKTARLDFGGRPVVTGQIVVDGRPVARVRVVLSEPTSRAFGVFGCNGMTDGQGNFELPGAPPGRYAVYQEQTAQRGEWIKVAYVDVGYDDVDLGVVPHVTIRLAVTLQLEQAGASADDWNVYVQEGTRLWGSRTGQVLRPTEQGAPHVVTGLAPGRYTVVAARSDGVRIRKAVTLGEQQQQGQVTLTMLAGTSQVSGRVTKEYGTSLMLWRQDKSLFAYLQAGDDGTYQIESLPAGKYAIGVYGFEDPVPFVEFDLEKDQSKVVDVTVTSGLAQPRASLSVLVVDESGVPLSNARIWLQGSSGKVEPFMAGGRSSYFVAEPGAYDLHVECPGYEAQTRPVTLGLDDAQTARGRRESPDVVVRLRRP